MSMIQGLPGESYEDVQTTVNFIKSLGVSSVYQNQLYAYPGTEFFVNSHKYGMRLKRLRKGSLHFSIENPPLGGEYRVFNQFEEVYDVTELAHKVQKVGCELGLDVRVRNIENPRKEMEEHYYNPDHQHLLDLGYKPTHDIEAELRIMLADLINYRTRIEDKMDVLIPDIRWDGSRRKSEFLS